ncbi:helix-turn-helix domain-containing protein [Paraburkholderia hospita]|uniref:helix-turn-helix domain-containing protein n=1 Tax=Paraburkholderia hospita TaxID=169430 RepID=UPI002ED591BE
MSEIVHPIAEGESLLNAANLSSKHRSHPRDGTPRRAPNRPRAMRETHGAFRTALRIIEEDLGIDLAQRVAASLVTPKRVPLSALPVKNANRQISEKIKASVLWLDANVEQPISIDTAAEVAAMSERNFLRRFKNEIGMTPSDYLLRARLNLSCRMLLESSLPVDKIARRCGFSNGGQPAKLFRKYFSKTPTDYRTKKDAATSTSAKVHGMSGSEAEDVIEPDRMPCR